jgi:cellulose biosynthesis protein BcsQ
MAKEPQASSAWAIAVGLSNLTLRGFFVAPALPAWESSILPGGSRLRPPFYLPPESCDMNALSLFSVLPLPTVLASAEPIWTDKEMLVALGSTLAAMIPVVLFVVRFATSWARGKTRRAEAERIKAQNELAKLKGDMLAQQPQLTELTDRLDQTQKRQEEAEVEAAKQRELAEQRGTELDSLRSHITGYENDLIVERRRVDRAARKDGQTWTEKVLHSAPAFKPLEPEGRRTPIISVLNLKGGVGKTTITANLGTALNGLGYRVLLLDLDLQGSLTSLFLSDSEQEQLSKQERWLEDFLAASSGAESPNLLDYSVPILGGSGSALVPTSDHLAYAETNLTIRWLLRERNRDPRFLLRRELQLKRITNQYDIVLMDCPPLINICCVNALAASDYVMVPIMPSKQATARVPVLLRRLRDLRENINSDLKVMGVVVNRTQRSELTVDEENRLSLLRDQCLDTWGQAVPQFGTFIRQNVQIRTAEDEHRTLRQEDEVYQSFLELAQEVQLGLPTFCLAATQPIGLIQEATS